MISNISILILVSLSFCTVNDIDGNTYETVQIGDQLWMAENLQVTHYRNGDVIPTEHSDEEWINLSSGGYAVYPADNDWHAIGSCEDDCAAVFGNLYNWFAVNDDRGICPEGWDIPTDDEVKILEMNVGMSESEANGTGYRGTNEGSKLSGHADLWREGNLKNDSEFGTSGFNAIPAGFRQTGTGAYLALRSNGYFWTLTEYNSEADLGWFRMLRNFEPDVGRNGANESGGFSVRCLENNITTGCTDPGACNYNADATIDDGSCTGPYLCDDEVTLVCDLEVCPNNDCDEGYTNIDDICYYQSDLDVLQQFIDNSTLSINMDMDTDNNGVIEPLELCSEDIGTGIVAQDWEDGRLTGFYCNDVGLSGNIPESIGSLINLEYLGLQFNAISGTIPEVVGELNNLWLLTLYDNEITGEIPNSIWNLTGIEKLYLGYNELSGAISDNVDNLINIEELYLAGNQLSGTVPESICNLPNLTNLWLHQNQLCPPFPECIEGMNLDAFYWGSQDTSNCVVEDVYGCTDPEACNYNLEAAVDDGSCEFCAGGCDGVVTTSNPWSDEYHYDFTYTLGELTDYENQPLQQIAQKQITSLIVTCQETGQIWSFDEGTIAAGNGNHDFSFLQERYEDFPLPARSITNGVLIGIDTYATGNYHSLWFSITAIDDEGNEFTHDNYIDYNPYGWNSSNEITFPGLYFTGIIDYANLDVLYAEGSFPVADITYEIGGDGYSYGFVCDENCEGSLSASDCEDSIELSLHEGSNLISFSVLPEDNSVANMLSDDNISAIAGEGEAAMNTDIGWVGSLTTVLYENGYWLLLNEASILNLIGIPIQLDQLYELHAGNNLISYPLSDCGSIDEVLPDEIEDCIYAIAGEGVAALHSDIGWVGSLTSLCPDEGYWFVNQCDEIEFTFDEAVSLARSGSLNEPPYPYFQSSSQAFYFIESIDNIEIGEWIFAYSGDKVIGAREWQGSLTDVPVMGNDGTKYTDSYIRAGEIPQFKVLRGDKLISVKGHIPAWSNNELFVVSNLKEAMELPQSITLYRAYPNPFNPATTLTFSVPEDINVLLEVYDINGKVISKLIDNKMKAGYHSIVWNSDKCSSGLYFVKMIAGDFIHTQKLILVK